MILSSAIERLMPQFAYPLDVSSKLTEVTLTPESMLKHCSLSESSDAEGDSSLSWRAALPLSADTFLDLIEALATTTTTTTRQTLKIKLV